MEAVALLCTEGPRGGLSQNPSLEPLLGSKGKAGPGGGRAGLPALPQGENGAPLQAQAVLKRTSQKSAICG